MFSQSAYKDPSVMVNQLKDYFRSVGSNNNWNQSYIDGLCEIVDTAYENNYSIFKFNSTIIEDMLVEIQDQYEQFSIMYTMNQVDTIPKYAKVYNVLSELIGTTDFIDKTESVSPIIEETIIDIAETTVEKTDNTFEKILPYVGLGVVAYFVLPRVIKAYNE